MSMTTAAAHTSGPWKWHWRFEDGLANGSVYAEPRAGHAYAVAICPKYQSREQWEADARLIAAAPELLAELKRLRLAYVNLLEVGRDRIVALGGQCDPIDVMEAGDPALRSAAAALAKTGAS